jgi:DNA-binding transcriptional MerR regulator
MKKSGAILIGEVAARGGVHPEGVRYYEKIGLLPKPHRAANGYRVYSESHLSRIDFIKRAQGLGLSLEEIRDVIELRDMAEEDSCQHVEAPLERKIAQADAQIEELKKYRKDLRQSLSSCQKTLREHADDALCPVIEQWDSGA